MIVNDNVNSTTENMLYAISLGLQKVGRLWGHTFVIFVVKPLEYILGSCSIALFLRKKWIFRGIFQLKARDELSIPWRVGRATSAYSIKARSETITGFAQDIFKCVDTVTSIISQSTE